MYERGPSRRKQNEEDRLILTALYRVEQECVVKKEAPRDALEYITRRFPLGR